MPRVLVAERHTVAEDARAGAMAEWRDRQARFRASGCHYWVFEQADARGEYLEFIEAPDAATLTAGRRAAGLPAGAATVYTEVELT